MGITALEKQYLERELASFKLNELQKVSLDCHGTKFGKKADVLNRIISFLEDPTKCDRAASCIRELVRLKRNPRGYPTSYHPVGQFPMPMPPYMLDRRNTYIDALTAKTLHAVRLIELPFYDFCGIILGPIELPASKNPSSAIKQTVRVPFEVSHTLLQALNNGSPGVFPRRELLLRFCLLEDNYEYKIREDEFPPSCAVYIDGKLVTLPSVIPVNRPNVEQKRLSRPVNITEQVQVARPPTHPIRCIMTIEWTADRRKWACSINDVWHIDSAELLQRVKTHPKYRMHREVTAEKIRKMCSNSGDDDEIASDRVVFSLKCPITRCRLTIPARGGTCQHIQCFDLKNFLQMNEKKPSWRCPCCNERILSSALVVDEYFVDMLNSVDAKTEEVEFHQNGSYSAVKEECVTVPSDDEDESEVKVDLKPSTSSSNSGQPPAKKKCIPDVVTIADSDDEQMSVALIASLQSSQQADQSLQRVNPVNNAPASSTATLASVLGEQALSTPTYCPQLNASIFQGYNFPQRSLPNTIDPQIKKPTPEVITIGEDSPPRQAVQPQPPRSLRPIVPSPDMYIGTSQAGNYPIQDHFFSRNAMMYMRRPMDMQMSSAFASSSAPYAATHMTWPHDVPDPATGSTRPFPGYAAPRYLYQ